MSAERAPLWRRYGWWIGAVVGVASVFVTAPLVQEAQEEREAREWDRRVEVFHRQEEFPPPVDVVRELLAQDGRVVVAERIADRVDAEPVAKAEELLKTTPVPVRVAYLPAPDLDSGYTASGAVAMWAGAVGEPGHYVGLFDDGRDEVYSIGYETPHLFDVETKGQPGPAILRVAEAAPSWDVEPLTLTPVSEYPDWGGTREGVIAGLLFAGIAVLPLFAGLRLAVGQLRTRRDS